MVRRYALILFSALLPGLLRSQCITAYPSLENFTGGTVGTPGTLVTGWSNQAGDDLDWWVDNNGTNGGVMSIQTGPIGDRTSNSTSGKYMYVEAGNAGGTPNKLAILQSNCYDLTSLGTPYLTFWYHMRGSQMGSLTVELNVNGTIIPNVWSASGDQGLKWRQGWVNLATYAAGQNNVRVRFRAVTGSGALSDIAIDDVWVGNLTPVIG